MLFWRSICGLVLTDVGPVKIPDGLEDEKVLFLGDIYPTGWQAAAQCDIEIHVNRWTGDLLRRVQEGQIEPSL